MKHPAVLFPLVFASVTMSLSLLLYGQLPDPVVVHWDVHGEPDGYAARPVALFVLPLLNLVLGFAIRFVHQTEPRESNRQRSSKALTALVVSVSIVLTVIHVALLCAALGLSINAPGIALGALGLLMTVVGIYMGKTRSDFSLGIRNRWTLSDDRIWDKTNRLGGRVLVAEGILALLLSLSGLGNPVSAILVIGLLALSLACLHWHSFYYWKVFAGPARS